MKEILEILKPLSYETPKFKIDACASEIESFIKDKFVEKEYLEWYKYQEEFMKCFVDGEEKWWHTNLGTTTTEDDYYSSNELHEYWLTNIKDK